MSVLFLIEEAVSQNQLADIVLGSSPGRVCALIGVDALSLRDIMDRIEPTSSSPRALFTGTWCGQTTEAVLEQLTCQLAQTALLLWPTWYTDVSFAGCGRDSLGRLAVTAIVRRAAINAKHVQAAWAETAAHLALNRHSPRLRNLPTAVEIEQLALAISRHGLVLIVDADQACHTANPAAVVHAMEWVAQFQQCSVVALFRSLPTDTPPFDRILYGARVFTVAEPSYPQSNGARGAEVPTFSDDIWISPWLGSPHPMSETEQRLEKALRSDTELAPLFGCNQLIETIHGSRPKVDFVWTEGRMVVELDGYGSHGNRAAFMHDRHRDYELTVSGYTVLRLANDEVTLDVGKAVEKIRDIVQLCRGRIQ